jgi:hypothetical protein
MRKFLLVLLIFTGTVIRVTPLMAQKSNHFGVKAGLNFASTTTGSIQLGSAVVEIEGSKMTGFHLGLFDNYSFSRRLGLQVEALFSAQGNETDKLSYINVPVLLELKPVKNLGILVGPQVGINVVKPDGYDGSYYVSGNSISFDALRRISDSNKIVPIDAGIVLGAQYTLLEHLVAGVRYNFGLTSIRTFDGANANISGYENRVIQFSIGWLF